jgi:hypothetical protein
MGSDSEETKDACLNGAKSSFNLVCSNYVAFGYEAVCCLPHADFLFGLLLNS